MAVAGTGTSAVAVVADARRSKEICQVAN